MSVTITVSQVRKALHLAAGIADGRGDGAPSTAVLGQWFHEGLTYLVGGGPYPSPLLQLSAAEADLDDWKRSLVEQVYQQFVGPRMTREQAALHGDVPQVAAFWQAMQAACHWLAELNWKVRSESSRHTSRRSATQAANGPALTECFSTEEPLTCVLREPGWSDSVRLVGVADAVMRLPHTGAWCAIEFKLGQASPAADLGQACLYHLMLSLAEADRVPEARSSAAVADIGTLGLVTFRPERHERLFTAHELSAAKQRLIELIGRLAGVCDAPPVPGETTTLTLTASAPDKPVARICTAAAPTEQHLTLGRNLVRTLAEYGVNVSLDKPVSVGPSFVRFPLALGRGTKVSAVTRYAPELQVRLQLKAEPFIWLDDGRLVIDVQRPDRQTVWFDEVLPLLETFKTAGGSSRVPVGINLSGDLVCADLSNPEHAHLLVAGTTGSGKSEWLRLAVAGLIATNTPDSLRLVVIDPKRNAFHALRNSPYLWQPLVFPDEQPAADVLEKLAEEMDRRYRQLDGADSYQQMARRTGAPLPRIVCVCDEYRDLISRSTLERKAIEAQIFRLGAKARAAGIHLILATQEPSRDTIRGALDANMPARVGLKMGKSVESRMLLNESGAENLLGHGDLLFKDIGQPRRLQAPLLTEANRTALFGRTYAAE